MLQSNHGRLSGISYSWFNDYASVPSTLFHQCNSAMSIFSELKRQGSTRFVSPRSLAETIIQVSSVKSCRTLWCSCAKNSIPRNYRTATGFLKKQVSPVLGLSTFRFPHPYLPAGYKCWFKTQVVLENISAGWITDFLLWYRRKSVIRTVCEKCAAQTGSGWLLFPEYRKSQG